VNSQDNWIAYYLWILLVLELINTYGMSKMGDMLDQQIEEGGGEPLGTSAKVIMDYLWRMLKWSPIIAYVFGFVSTK
jgi:hypothetical protein